MSKTYICRICGDPIEVDSETATMMEFFNMPEDGGAHNFCLGVTKEGKSQ